MKDFKYIVLMIVVIGIMIVVSIFFSGYLDSESFSMILGSLLIFAGGPCILVAAVIWGISLLSGNASKRRNETDLEENSNEENP